MLRRLMRIPGIMKLESGILHGHKPCCQLYLGRLLDARWRSLAAAAEQTCRQDRLRSSAAAASASVSAQQQQTESLPLSHAQQSMSWAGRDHNCGELREQHAGQQMTICGWVHRHRNLGGVLFCDIRDSTGILQVGLLCAGASSSWLPAALHCSGQGRPARHKGPHVVQPACCSFLASSQAACHGHAAPLKARRYVTHFPVIACRSSASQQSTQRPTQPWRAFAANTVSASLAPCASGETPTPAYPPAWWSSLLSACLCSML